MKSDTQLQSDVLGEMQAELGAGVSKIGVSVSDGAVILRGKTPTYREKYAAELAALRVPGVRAVCPGIEVGEFGAPHFAKDDEVTKAVAQALQAPEVPAGVRATVEDGWVTLRGEVRSPVESDAAVNAVRRRAGAKWVYNLITIRPAEFHTEN